MTYAEFVKAISGILYRIDPIGLSGAPADEYEPEAERIMAALGKGIQDTQALKAVVDAVFTEQFNSALNAADVDNIANEIWDTWESEHRRIDLRGKRCHGKG